MLHQYSVHILVLVENGVSASAKRELFECLPFESLFGNILRAPSQAFTKKIAEHLLLLELNKSHFSGCREISPGAMTIVDNALSCSFRILKPTDKKGEGFASCPNQKHHLIRCCNTLDFKFHLSTLSDRLDVTF